MKHALKIKNTLRNQYTSKNRSCFSIAATLSLTLIISSTSHPAFAESSGQSNGARGKVEASQKPQLVTGTRVMLVEPAGFQPSPTFSGFADPNGKSSILVTEMNAPYEKLTGGFTNEGLATRGLKLIEKQDLKVDTYPGLLLFVGQDAGGQDFRKWITVFGDDKESVLITATIPTNHPNFDKLSGSLKQIVMNPVWKRDVKVDKLANLMFSLEACAPFKLAERVQNTLLYTIDGKMSGRQNFNEPLYAVTQSLGVTPSSDKKVFAQNRLKQTAYMREIKEDSIEPTEISGVQGYKIKASAIDKDTNEPMYLGQTILFGSKVYYLVQAIVPKGKLATYSEAFDKMTKSLKLQP